MKYLSVQSDVMGGALCIRGTRIPVDEVLFLLEQGNSVRGIERSYPWVPKDVLRGAIHEALSEAMTLLAAKHHA